MNVKLFSERNRKKILLFSMFFIFIVSAQAQKTVTGIVTDGNLPLPGANVEAKGTSATTTTDFDGKFSFNVPAGATNLVVSFIGYATKEVAITEGVIKITLAEDSNQLEEVVINVGYGTVKKRVSTGAISKVTARDLEKVPNGSVETALQGRAAGVTIAMNAGQPGSRSTVRVRGITTLNGGNDPLYVVDGVVIDPAALGSINQSDIESMELLKDAASSAIYGARSARGVILITTKKGKSGKLTVNYNGFYGVSSPEKTLSLLNATQYGALMNERYVNGGGQPSGIPYPNLGALGKGTDWQKAIFSNDAERYSHEMSLSGGNEKSSFYLSFGTQRQEGIVMKEISSFEKKTIRLNSTHNVTDWFTVGQTASYTHQNTVGIGNTNSEYGGPLSSAINLDPLTPLVETDPILSNGVAYSNPYVIRDGNGNPYGISQIVGQEMTNPLAYAKTRYGQYNWSDDFIANVYGEIKLMKGLKFRTTLGTKLSYWGGQGFTPLYYLSPTVNNTTLNNISRIKNDGFDWNVENTLTYDKKVNEHSFNVLLGQGGYRKGFFNATSATHFGLQTNDYRDATFNSSVTLANQRGYNFDVIGTTTSSLFGRLTYDYKEKYLFTGLIRRDGSSNFGANNKYGNFPSFSAGWVITKEDFWKENNAVNEFKIRLGYGITGNDEIGAFNYLGRVDGGRNYSFGTDGTVAPGFSPGRIDNPDLKWEETTQTNIGFDARLFNDFTLTFEWFKKKTSGILRDPELPDYIGNELPPYINMASMNNSGLEFELGYKKKINGLNLSVNANLATLKNEVTYITAGNDFYTSVGFQSMGPIDRTQVGQPINSFYGYQTAGIFQNQAEVNAYTNTSGGLIQPNAQPGDFRWRDNNGDGTITEDDKAFLGSPLPKVTFGFTINMDYKNFDLMIFAQGAAGNKIFQGLRRLDVANANYSTEALSRWTGEGTSNSFPRLTTNDSNGNFTNMSDFYLEDGDYLRFKVVQLGYSLPNTLTSKVGIQKLRLYVSGENLLTLTKYSGFDPEIGGNVFGLDRGYYPQARSILFGANFQF
ncbi:MAG: TonB-dependent receptor [Flavobacterium sp. JAD_PAG50586_2]|nr:MAG: TonB-dependent receptor [Flavobacterium sp. JAD_PAG50586_2]